MKAILLALAIGVSTLGIAGTASADHRDSGGRGFDRSHYSGGHSGGHPGGYHHGNVYPGYPAYRGYHDRPTYTYSPIYCPSYAPARGYPGYVQPGLSFGFSFGR